MKKSAGNMMIGNGNSCSLNFFSFSLFLSALLFFLLFPCFFSFLSTKMIDEGKRDIWNGILDGSGSTGMLINEKEFWKDH